MRLIVLILLAFASGASAASIHVGAYTSNITPEGPVAVDGQMMTRIAREVESELKANALAIEARDGDSVVEQAIFVACDLVAIREGIYERVRELLAPRIPDFDVKKLVLSATHTHTAPVTLEDIYHIEDADVIRPSAYVDFLVPRIAEAAERAWKSREAVQVGWGMGYAVVGYNRRSYFADGRHQMYGNLSVDDFRGIEGPEDHAVEVLYFWGAGEKLIATAINVVCPSQEVESRSAINADFWHPVREGLKAKYGEDLVVVGWTGAAGDQSPHIRYRQAAEDRMREFRGLDRMEEIARRIILAWEEALDGAQQDKRVDVPFAHDVRDLELPERMVTEEEVEEARAEIASFGGDPKFLRRVRWHEKVVERFDRQQSEGAKPYIMQLHALRLGDVAITTNNFELYTQYGIQMKAKSPALHTFVIQLAGPGSYVPTPHAAAGGGYSAIVQSNEVGPEGGQVLVDETVKAVNELWGEAGK